MNKAKTNEEWEEFNAGFESAKKELTVAEGKYNAIKKTFDVEDGLKKERKDKSDKEAAATAFTKKISDR